MTHFSKKKVISQKGGTGSSPAYGTRITNLENNVYKVTYYEIISGTSGSITLPTGATINSGEFGLSGNAVLSEINGSNKPTYVSPKDASNTIVTASLNPLTGVWIASGTTVSTNVALIYSLNIKAIDYSNLNNFYIIETINTNSSLSTPQGLIQIYDPLGEFFTSLATATAYIRTFYPLGSLTDESFNNNVYSFTVPAGSNFSSAVYFLCDPINGDPRNATIIDTFGLIGTFGDFAIWASTGNNTLGDCTFGDFAFYGSTGNNILGDCTFGDFAFWASTGNNTLGDCTFGTYAFESSIGIYNINNIILNNSLNIFAQNSIGRFYLNGTIGTNTTAEYPNFFLTSTAEIRARNAAYTNNAGGIEGDLLTAQTNGAKLFFGGIDKENILNKVTTLVGANNTTYPTTLAVNNELAKYTLLQSRVTSGGQVTVGTFGGVGTDNDIRVTPTTWFIQSTGVTYSTLIDTDFLDIALSTAGNQRWVDIFGDTSGTITKVEGLEAVLAAHPAQPTNTVLINSVLVGDASISPFAANKYVEIVKKDITNGPNITSTAGGIFLAKTIEIDPGTYVVGDTPVFSARTIKNNASGTFTSYIYINTSNTLVGATLVGFFANTNAKYLGIIRDLLIKTPTVTQVLDTASSGSTSEFIASGVNPSNLNIDFTVKQYVMCAVQSSLISHVMYCSSLVALKR